MHILKITYSVCYFRSSITKDGLRDLIEYLLLWNKIPSKINDLRQQKRSLLISYPGNFD